MTHDPLWDPRHADAEAEALERLLAPLRHAGRPLPALPPQQLPARRWPLVLACAAAAVALLAFGTWWWWTHAEWSRLRPGMSPRTLVAETQPRRYELEGVGSIELRAGTVLELEDFSAARARFRLLQGRIAARIKSAPFVAPRFFQVATQAADCIDLGCSYELEVRADGRAHVQVSDGQVVFQFGDREVYVPAGAECLADPGRGPFTPHFRDARPELQKRLYQFDAAAGAPLEQRLEAAKQLFAVCREGRDTLPLWHLLRDPEPLIREMAEKHLLDLAGEPPAPGGKDVHWDLEEWKAHLRLTCWSAAK